MERFTFLYRSTGYDAVILQREMISTLPTLEKLLPKPLIMDVDDAIFLYRNGRAAKYVAAACSLVVCGNQYLADKFFQWNSNVVVIPTGVDTDRLRPIANRNINATSSIIGWIGTSGNFSYLESIEPALRKILSSYPTTRLQIISNQFPTFLKYLGEQLDFKKWYPGIENDLLPHFTIGIMPLPDNEWARGKCAFKMLQYMAAGIPVVVTPIGMNAEILASCSVGLAAQNNEQWLEALSTLLRSSTIAESMGANGRQLVEKKYSLAVVSLKWQHVLKSVVLQ
ncbi:MAG: glycosyltransferase [Candidatus Electrothrix sp. ATG2]|nr:glycosyltransferase [Candidatus Electrothrix sp. ATG2]